MLHMTKLPIQLLNPSGSQAGQVLSSEGPLSAPTWAYPDALKLINSVPVAHGGTGATTAAGALSNLGAAPIASPAFTGTATFEARPTFNGKTPWDSGNLSFLTPPAIGATTPNTGAFTSLSSSLNSAVYSSNTGGQSISTGTVTTVTGWTAGADRNSNWNATTGVFTAPRAGYYWIAAQVGFASASFVAGTLVAVQIKKGATVLLQGNTPIQANFSNAYYAQAAGVVSLAAGDTITVGAFQSSGATIALNTGANSNYVSIAQIP